MKFFKTSAISLISTSSLKSKCFKCNKWLSERSYFHWTRVLVTVLVVILFLGDHKATGQLLPPPKKLHRVIAGFYAYHPSYDSDKKAPIASTNKHSPTIASPPLLYHHPPTTTKHHPSKGESQKNAIHYHKYHAEHNLGDKYKYHQHIRDSERPKYHDGKGYHLYKSSHTTKYKKVKKVKEYEKKYVKTSTKYKSSHYHKGSKKAHYHEHKGGYTTGGFYTGGSHGHLPPNWPYLSKVYEGYMVLARKMAEYYGHKYNYPPHLLYVSICF